MNGDFEQAGAGGAAARELWSAAAGELPPAIRAQIRRDEPMRRHTTLRVGGPADLFFEATSRDDLAEIAMFAQVRNLPLFLLGEGSNICVSDSGIRGLVVRNACRAAEIASLTRADAGHNFMRLFLKTMQAGLTGLEFAVGIPGSVGGALVSNAGAYRANICDFVREIEVAENGERKTVGPEWMGFSYRDSRMRRGDSAVLLGVTLELTPAPKTPIRLKAKDFQRQRIAKQPWEPSAGSWFKNVYDRDLAESLPALPDAMKRAGVVPAAYLSEACGCKGLRIGDAAVSPRHANFFVNMGQATASDIQRLAATVKERVRARFGRELEAEVLSVGE